MSQRTKNILSLFLLCAILVGLGLAAERAFLESQSYTVEIAVDYDDLQKLSLLDKVSGAEVIFKLKGAGMTSIGLPEQTIDSAQEAGNLVWAPGYVLQNTAEKSSGLLSHLVPNPNRSYNYIHAFDLSTQERVFNELTNLLGTGEVWLTGTVIVVDHLAEELKTFGIGFDPKTIAWLKNQGFYVIPRLSNNPFYRPSSIENKFYLLRKNLNANCIIFGKEEVLGYPNYLPSTAQALKNFQLKFGYVEMIQQDGDQGLARRMGDQIVKVQSIPAEKIIENKIDKNQAIVRFSRAVKERGVRLLYIHPFFNLEPAQNFVPYNQQYLSELSQEVRAAGLRVGEASAVQPFSLNWALVLILGLGVFSLCVALLKYFAELDDNLVYMLFASFLCLELVTALSSGFLMLQIALAALAAVVAPTFAIISNFNPEPAGYSLPKAIQIFLNCVAETLLGIILIIGLLADSRFMVGAELFRGIKIVLVLPVLIVIAYFFYKDEYGTNLKEKLKTFLALRIGVATLCWAGLFLAVLAFAVARSDNFILPVFGAEKIFREILEKIMFVRPRIKEFLIGYPFLFLAAAYCLNRHKKWLWLLLALGTIGLTSLTNTFCHIHTPLLYSVLRSINGMVLGLIIGIIMSLFFIRRDQQKGQ
ncbi:MAG: DUF5693 family protein [Candidatus Margulisiibacteriota bacterium]